MLIITNNVIDVFPPLWKRGDIKGERFMNKQGAKT
jgi:hypothetical protein